MRTTVDLPDDLHQLVVSLARDLHQSLSATVADLMRRGLGDHRSGSGAGVADIHLVDGFPTLRGGRATSADDVRRLDDES